MTISGIQLIEKCVECTVGEMVKTNKNDSGKKVAVKKCTVCGAEIVEKQK